MSEEQIETSAPEVSAEPAVEAAPAATESTEVASPETGEVATPAYSPNFKYKVFGEDKEMPEKFRSLITDQASEKEMRDFFEKADALPTIKQRFEEARTRYSTLENTLKTEIQPKLEFYHGLADSLRTSYEKQDFQGICEALGIPVDNLLGLAAKEANLRQDPAAYKLAQAEREKLVADRTASTQLSEKDAKAMEVESRYITRMLDMTMAREDVKQYAEAFEARMGKPGSFEEEVRHQGNALYMMGRQADPVEIIESMMKKFPMGAVSPMSAVSPAKSSAGIQSAGKPPVIPTVQGSAVSPSSKKKGFKSIADMQTSWQNERNGG